VQLQSSRSIGNTTILLIDASGKIVKTEALAGAGMTAELTIATNNFANGNYMIVARTKEDSVSEHVSITQ
jgi:hypothetical protein